MGGEAVEVKWDSKWVGAERGIEAKRGIEAEGRIEAEMRVLEDYLEDRPSATFSMGTRSKVYSATPSSKLR